MIGCVRIQSGTLSIWSDIDSINRLPFCPVFFDLQKLMQIEGGLTGGLICERECLEPERGKIIRRI